jgi:hypothetical protein
MIPETAITHWRRTVPWSQDSQEDNLAEKVRHPGFHGDLAPLLAAGEVYDPEIARDLVVDQLISRL